MVKKRRTKRPVLQKPAGIGAQEPARSQNPENRLARFFTPVERRVTGQEPAEPAQSVQELTERLTERLTNRSIKSVRGVYHRTLRRRPRCQREAL
jgi:hypothetical protein